MRDKNGVKIVFYCGHCAKVKPFDYWQQPNEEAKKAIQEQRQNGMIKFVKSICDVCLRV